MAALLERDEHLAALEDARARGGRLVFVGGEAGVGKTALVRSFEAQTDARVLHGSCENLTTPIPLGPFADIAVESGGQLADALSGERRCTHGRPCAPRRDRRGDARRARGRALGRRGHSGHSASPRQARGRDERVSSSRPIATTRWRATILACRAGRARLGAGRLAAERPSALAHCGSSARRAPRGRRSRAPSPHRRERVLRHRDPRHRGGDAARVRARRSARKSGVARRPARAASWTWSGWYRADGAVAARDRRERRLEHLDTCLVSGW